MKRPLSSLVGFTIIELLVVISVIGILVAITLVSYSGVSSRATIATMQSDLSSASTALRLDQATTDSFPASLALANNGRGIAPSQSMDSIIYIPDNTSNPKNFCLQYRKGTNTYAVDATTQPSKGVCLQNLVTNGDFSNGVTGWGSSTITGFSASLNEASYTPIGQWGQIYTPGFSAYLNNVYYVSTTIYGDVGTYFQASFLNNYSKFVTTGGVYQRMSYIGSSALTNSSIKFDIVTNKTSGWTLTKVKNSTAINLTATFGAGNEPSLAQMDTIMSNYPNSWFNITAKANL